MKCCITEENIGEAWTANVYEAVAMARASLLNSRTQLSRRMQKTSKFGIKVVL
jgi:hypothetical protein